MKTAIYVFILNLLFLAAYAEQVSVNSLESGPILDSYLSTVRVLNNGSNGSGVLLTYLDQNFLVTNAHVIGSAEECRETVIVQSFTQNAVRSYVEETAGYSSANIDGQLLFLDIISSGQLRKEFVSSEFLTEVLCRQPVFINLLIDIAIFEVSKKNINEDLKALELVSQIDEHISEPNTSVKILGHPQGRDLTISQNCTAKLPVRTSPWSSVDLEIYEFQSNCTTEGGNSGGPVFLEDSSQIIGISRAITTSTNIISGETKTTASTAVYFPNIASALKEYLDGNDKVGIFSPFKKTWTPVSGKFYLILEFDYSLLDEQQQSLFFQLSNKIRSVFERMDRLEVLQNRGINIMPQAPNRLPRAPVIFFNDSEVEIEEKLIRLMNF